MKRTSLLEVFDCCFNGGKRLSLMVNDDYCILLVVHCI